MPANADSKAEPILVNIVLKAADKAFRLLKFLITLRLPASYYYRYTPSNLLLPRRDAGVTPRTNDVDLTGTYYNAGYGTGMLCSVHSSSPSCQRVLDAFRSLSPNSTSHHDDPFASWITVFSTHICFTYTNDSQYGTRFLLGRSTHKATAKNPRRFRP